MAKKETSPSVEEEKVTTAAEEPAKDDPVAELNRAMEEEKDKYLRLAAEYDNYRKRTAKEKESIYADAKIETITAMLGVYDNLQRGIAQYGEEDSPHRKGLEMILQQFCESLARLGVTEMATVGQPFDPERHNAVMHVDDEAVGENVVVEELQKGFLLGEKVLRFAIVKVAN